jgi:hypothetical protein
MPAAESNVTALTPGQKQIELWSKRPKLSAGDLPRAIVPTTIEQVWRFAELAFKSELAPKDMDSAEKCAVAILHGLEVGLPPMQALQRICVINGRPTIWGDAVLGLVRSSGLLETIQEEITGENGAMVATCTVKRVGEAAVTRSFSAEDAKVAKLWDKAGPWQQYRKRMMQMRARAFALRDVFPDVTGGMYLREELDNGDMKDVSPPEPPEPDQPAAAPAPVEPPEPAQAEPLPAETLEIPEALRRNPKPTTIEGKAVEVFDVDAWLRDLQGAFEGCEDAVQLADAQTKYMTPHKGKVSDAVFENAGSLAVEAFARITRGG